MVVLFARAMIDAAIERVSKTGDEAVQAKAMIPEFLMMNVKMTILLSLPFLSTLWLNEFGYIERLQYSAGDRFFFEYLLSCFAKDWMLVDMYKGIEGHSPVHIMVSNLYFMLTSSLILLIACFKKLSEVFQILFHRPSYRFLRSAPKMYSGSSMRHSVYIALLCLFLVTLAIPTMILAVRYN